MKKLTLNELEVESFATVPTSQEIDQLKGGTGLACAKAAGAVVAAVSAAYAAWSSYQPTTTTTTTVSYDSTGVMVDSTVVTSRKFVGGGGNTEE